MSNQQTDGERIIQDIYVACGETGQPHRAYGTRENAETLLDHWRDGPMGVRGSLASIDLVTFESNAVYHVGWDGTAFPCPDCGNKIRSPFGGHTWTCHETYGGCGASFEPVKALQRVDDGSTGTDSSLKGEARKQLSSVAIPGSSIRTKSGKDPDEFDADENETDTNE